MSKTGQSENVARHPRASEAERRNQERNKGKSQDECDSVLSGPDCIEGVDDSAPRQTDHVGKPSGSALDSPESMIEGAEEAKRKRDPQGSREN